MQLVIKLVISLSQAGAKALSAVWTFPSILLSAFMVAWAAEAAQFMISQGLALALLAWLQTLPEFAVEAVIAWEAGKDPEKAHLAIANLTGAIRLLLGLGWPMIYFVFAFAGRRSSSRRLPTIKLAPEHSIEIIGLFPPLFYFVVILVKHTISWVDAVILIALYFAYLWVLFRHPPQGVEHMADAPAVSRWALRYKGWKRRAAVGGLFAVGGGLLYATAHPFLESMLALAAILGVSQFVLVQWVAPFLSEFPEKLSAFYWARRVTQAPMALMNMVSSNINQWTILAAMIPLVYGYSHMTHTGSWAPFPFDAEQRMEILLTMLQTALGGALLANLEFDWRDASALFVLWLAQFLVPHLREEVAVAYGVWIAVLLIGFMIRGDRLLAPRYFLQAIRRTGQFGKP